MESSFSADIETKHCPFGIKDCQLSTINILKGFFFFQDFSPFLAVVDQWVELAGHLTVEG